MLYNVLQGVFAGVSFYLLIFLLFADGLYSNMCNRSQDSRDARNPGNNLYVTGLSTRITSSDLEKYFSKEGSVCALCSTCNIFS